MTIDTESMDFEEHGECDIKVPDSYWLNKRIHKDHKDWAISSLVDFMLLFVQREDIRVPSDYLHVIDALRHEAMPLIDEAIAMTLDIVMGNEDPDTVE